MQTSYHGTHRAKDIRLAFISSADASLAVKRFHYSGKVCSNSQVHIGAFLDGRLEGAMQFGPSMDKRKIMPLVHGTAWNGFLELNRMAFSDRLPRNSESRALGIALRMIRASYPHIQWIVSFADAAQCGDGTIYRAAGFVLTGIKKNTSIWRAPDGATISHTSIATTQFGAGRGETKKLINRLTRTKGLHILATGASSMTPYRAAGWRPLDGFQLRYLYFLDPTARQRLTVPILPFATIDELGARMYLGKSKTRPKQAMTGDHPEQRRCDTDPDAPLETSA